jgi:hypothetical protein
MMRRLLVVLTLLGIVLSGCTLGPREEWAKAMRDASKKAEQAGGSNVQVVVTMKVIQTTIRVVPSPLFSALSGVVDYKNRKSKLLAKSSYAPRGSLAYYDDLVTYLRRSPGSITDHNSDRPWARFDFTSKPKPDKIDATDRLASLGYVIAPSLAVELLKGVLAGSLKELGTSQMDGEAVTEYSGRLAPDAVTRDLRDQPRVDGITRMFKIIGVSQDIFPFHVWMDSRGLARRIQLQLKQQEDIVDSFRSTVDYTFSKYGPVPVITTPQRTATLGHRRFLDFANEYTRASV